MVSVDLVNEVVGVNVTDGPRIMPKMNELEKLECLKIVLKNEHLTEFPLELVKVSNLDVPERILHYVIAQSFFCKKKGFGDNRLGLILYVPDHEKRAFQFWSICYYKDARGFCES